MEKILKWTINHATELDLLSEQVTKSEGSPISDVPLAWSHAFFILTALGLDELKAAKK
jgi:glucoamylase